MNKYKVVMESMETGGIVVKTIIAKSALHAESNAYSYYPSFDVVSVTRVSSERAERRYPTMLGN
jgi:hypothetical protein